MCTNTRLTLTALATIVILLAACSPMAKPAMEPVEVTQEEVEREAVVVGATPTPAAAGEDGPTGGYTPVTLPDRPNRLIIKNAELKLLVADTDVAIDRVTQIAADTGGYIISSRIRYDEWLGKKYKYASITIGVPVDRFELAMRRLRNVALRVMDETASGQDVSDEYVDLQSRLGNLEATRDRIRQFLDQAQTVEESLRVNEELAAIEEQIEQVRGRMNYLFDRAAYSTITVQIDPELPQPTHTPTPPWSPSQTVQQAGQTLGSIARVLTEIAIWFAIVVVPLLAPPVAVVWGVRRWIRRKEP